MLRALSRGFTLIELVIGIVVFSIVLVIVTTLIAPQAIRSVEPILQVRATELAQSLINEITAKSFDENSDRSGGMLRCGETGAPSCSAIGNDGQSRSSYNDVDDYDGLDESGGDIKNSQGEAIQMSGRNLYEGFRAQVSVFYDDDRDGLDDGAIGDSHKLIRVAITTPNDQQLVFSTYRSNF